MLGAQRRGVGMAAVVSQSGSQTSSTSLTWEIRNAKDRLHHRPTESEALEGGTEW